MLIHDQDTGASSSSPAPCERFNVSLDSCEPLPPVIDKAIRTSSLLLYRSFGMPGGIGGGPGNGGGKRFASSRRGKGL